MEMNLLKYRKSKTFPTIQKELEVTMMERLVNLHGEKVVQMLTMQYRLDNKKGGGMEQELYIFLDPEYGRGVYSLFLTSPPFF